MAFSFPDSCYTLKVNPITAGLAAKLGRSLCRSVKSYIFVANTGRCGSNTLQKYFECIKDGISLHEPHPILNGNALKFFNRGDEQYLQREFRLRKIPYMYWNAKFHRYYVETSNLFIKAYATEIAKTFGSKLKVIHLYRDRDGVARSLYWRSQSKDIFDADAPVWNWLIEPWASRNILHMGKDIFLDGKFSHEYFVFLWQCYEVEARIIDFGISYPCIPIIRFQTEDLNNIQAVEQLFEALDLPTPANLHNVVGRKFNTSQQAPKWPEGLSLNAVVDFHRLCQEQMSDKGMQPVCGNVPKI